MPINSISPGNYNSPSIQPEAADLRPVEKKHEVEQELKRAEVVPEHTKSTINANGQVIGAVINTKA